MAILREIIDVNNGNTGWTKANVLDALETAFANLGFHGGTAINGVPSAVIRPDGTRGWGGTWDSVAREPGQLGGGYQIHTYDVISQGTTSYRVLRKYDLVNYTSSGANSTEDTISFTYNHNLTTGDPIHWAPGETESTKNINGLTLDTVYYVIVVDRNTIKLALNATDASNGTEIDLLYGNIWTDSAALGSDLAQFRDIDDAQFDNRTVVVGTGDRVVFDVNDTSGGDFSLCGGTDNYDDNKRLNDSDFRTEYAETSQGSLASTSNITSGQLSWTAYYWKQTETERDLPNEQIPLAYRSDTNPDYYQIKKYIYASDTHASMKGEIRVVPRVASNAGWNPYFKYTVPASGSRSALKLRIYRDTDDANEVHGVSIHSVGSGWSSGETFTIPGDQIGGVTPDDDITFGTSTVETSTDAGDGIPEILITNIGAGSNFFQKSDSGKFAVMKVVNDAAKNYGTSYYSFSTADDNFYHMYINSGSHWKFLNKVGTQSTAENDREEYGEFAGVPGLDRNYSYNYANRDSDNSFTRITIASTSTPTSYPMSIRTYRAQSPQDTNFAVIQFCQTINGIVEPYGTFTVHRGSSFGSDIWDLDDVFLGTITTYQSDSGGRSVDTYYKIPGYYNSTSTRPTEEPAGQYSRARESSYGYNRDPDYGYSLKTSYACNIDTNNDESGASEIMTYYRNSNYDSVTHNGILYNVTSNADYYKPIKGLPVAHNAIPCPYYLPDDFVMLQFATTPGATVFRPGDTVTISASEIYEVILAGYETSQNGLDNVSNNTSIGMLFLARTT